MHYLSITKNATCMYIKLLLIRKDVDIYNIFRELKERKKLKSVPPSLLFFFSEDHVTILYSALMVFSVPKFDNNKNFLSWTFCDVN